MAEKYGTMPKRFTKEWWEHYWYYYKWRFGFALLTIAVVTVTCVQCASRIDYDATMSYIGCKYYYPQNVEVLIKAIENDVIDDANADGKVFANFLQMNVAKAGSPDEATEYNNAMHSKIAVQLQAGDTYLYLFNRQELDRMLSRDAAEHIFVKAEDIYKNEIPESRLVKKDDVVYGVSVEGNKFLEDHKFMSEDVYLAVRRMRQGDEDDEEEIAKYNNAIKIANYIVENQ